MFIFLGKFWIISLYSNVGKEIILLIIGGFISLIVGLILIRKKKSSEKKQIKETLTEELIATKATLALNAFYVDMKYGTYDYKTLVSTRENIDGLKDSESKKKITQILSTFAKVSDEEIEKRAKIYSDFSIKDRGIGVDIKKTEMPYLASQYDKISYFGKDTKGLLIEIYKRNNSLNQEIDNGKRYLDLTHSLTGENHQRNLLNLEDSNKLAGKLSKRIIELINFVLTKLED